MSLMVTIQNRIISRMKRVSMLSGVKIVMNCSSWMSASLEMFEKD